MLRLNFSAEVGSEWPKRAKVDLNEFSINKHLIEKNWFILWKIVFYLSNSLNLSTSAAKVVKSGKKC